MQNNCKLHDKRKEKEEDKNPNYIEGAKHALLI